MQAAEKPDGIDFKQLIPQGFMNDSHRAVPQAGAQCVGQCSTASPAANCPVHGGSRQSVLIGIPDSVEHAGVGHSLADRDGKVGWYSHFHLIDRKDPASWRNPDGSPRSRMLRDGTVTGEPFTPTAEELDRADRLWELGLRLQREGRTIGQSIQGRETVVPCEDGKRVVRAKVHQIALIEFMHNPDATVESLGGEMAKGVPPIVVELAARLLRQPAIRRRYNICTKEHAILAAGRLLRAKGIYQG
jgi:hypothetical protein